MRGLLTFGLIAIAPAAGLAQSLPTFITAPIQTIGSDSTAGVPSPLVFDRLVDAKRLSDGRIVAAVCGPNELRSFDASGRHVATLPIPNSLPPQRYVWRLFPAGGDTLAVYTGINSGLTLIDPSFKVARAIEVPNPDSTTFQGRPRNSQLNVVGRFADGTFLGRLQKNPATDTGVHRRRLGLYRFDGTGKLLDSIFVPGNEDRIVTGQRMNALRLARSTSIALSGDRLIIADQAQPFLVEHGADLKPVRRIETLTKPVPVNDSIRRAWTEAALARRMMPVNGTTPVFGDFYPESTAAVRDLVSGSDGRLWAQDPMGADHYPLVWTAYHNGRPVGRAELPARFYPTQFGPDWVLGLAYDSTTTDRIQLLALKPAALTNARLTPRDASPANRPRCGAWVSR